MNNFQKEFMMSMFLDNDNVCTINRLVVAVANIVNENNENINTFYKSLPKEFHQTSQTGDNRCSLTPITRRIKGFYENTVRNYTDEDYIVKFKMRKSTVQVIFFYYVPLVSVHGRGRIFLKNKCYRILVMQFFICLLSGSDKILEELCETRYHIP